jgi:hypothetical protein
VTCGWFAIVQRKHRFTPFQLDVKLTRVPIYCLPWPEIARRIERCRPTDLLNRYLLALPADEG